jgi:phosphoribosylformylglycinamidine synthase
MIVGVVTFPGSNCDADARYASQLTLDRYGLRGLVHRVWHKDTSLPAGLDVVILPGGFSYGDYLRTGAIARFSPIMPSVVDFANSGGYVFGVCNGFQILCETGLLPGALIRNANLKFVCKDVFLRVERADTAFTNAASHASRYQSPLRIPIAHGEGRYLASADELDRLEGEGRVLFRYVDAQGNVTADANPNGSQNNIAGILNAAGNVMGLMPHPERAMEDRLGSADGAVVFDSLVAALAERTGNTVSTAQFTE